MYYFVFLFNHRLICNLTGFLMDIMVVIFVFSIVLILVIFKRREAPILVFSRPFFFLFYFSVGKGSLGYKRYSFPSSETGIVFESQKRLN